MTDSLQGPRALPVAIQLSTLPRPPLRIASQAVQPLPTPAPGCIDRSLPSPSDAMTSSAKPNNRIMGSLRQKQQRVKDKLSNALSALGPSASTGSSSPMGSLASRTPRDRELGRIIEPPSDQPSISTLAFPSNLSVSLFTSTPTSERLEALELMWGELNELRFSTLPLSANSPPAEHPSKWSDWVRLYRLGAIDLNNPPPLPLQDPAAIGARVFAQAQSPAMQVRPRIGSLSSTGTSNHRRTSRAQSVGDNTPAGESSFAPSSVSSSSFSHLFDRAAPSLCVDDSARAGQQLSSSDDDEDFAASPKDKFSSPDHSDTKPKEVWHVSLSGSDDSDEDVLSPFGTDRRSMGKQVIRFGLRAPNPCFERERQAAANLYRPEQLVEDLQSTRAAKPSMQPALITKSIIDEVSEEEMATAPYDSLQVVVERTLSRLLEATQCDGVAFVLIDRDIRRLVSGAGRTVEGGRQCSRLRSIEAHLILNRNEGMVILDLASDVRFADRPTFFEETAMENRSLVRFYAGMPILSSSGMPLGAVSVFDSQHRIAWPESHRRVLESTAVQLNEALEEVLANEWKARDEKLKQSMSVFLRAMDRMSPTVSPLSSSSSIALHVTAELPSLRSPSHYPPANHSRSSSKRPTSSQSRLHDSTGRREKSGSFSSMSSPLSPVSAYSIADEVRVADGHTDSVQTSHNYSSSVPTADSLADPSRTSLLRTAMRSISAALNAEVVYLARQSCRDPRENGSSSTSASANPETHIVANCGLESATSSRLQLSWEAHAKAMHAPQVYQNVKVRAQKGKMREDSKELRQPSSLPWWYADRRVSNHDLGQFRSGIMVPCANFEGCSQSEADECAYILVALSQDSRRTYWAPEVSYLEQMAGYIRSTMGIRPGSHSRPGSVVGSSLGIGGVRSDNSSRSSTHSRNISFADNSSSLSIAAPTRSSVRSRSRPNTAESVDSSSNVSLLPSLPSLTSAESSPRAPFYALSNPTSFRSVEEGKGEEEDVHISERHRFQTDALSRRFNNTHESGGLGLAVDTDELARGPYSYRKHDMAFYGHDEVASPAFHLPFSHNGDNGIAFVRKEDLLSTERAWPSAWTAEPDVTNVAYEDRELEVLETAAPPSEPRIARRNSMGRLALLRSRAAHDARVQSSPRSRKASLNFARDAPSDILWDDKAAASNQSDIPVGSTTPPWTKAFRLPRLGSALTIRQTPSLKELRGKVMGSSVAASGGE